MTRTALLLLALLLVSCERNVSTPPAAPSPVAADDPAVTSDTVAASAAAETGDPRVTDYLVQNVCIDNGQIVPLDPATCPNSRNLRPGEVPPYLLTDFNKRKDGKRYQAVSSIPDGDGRIRIGKLMDVGAGFDHSFEKSRDAYDLIENDGAFVSIVATSDQQCWEQRFAGAGDGDGWILFPTTLPQTAGSTRHGMTLLRLSPPRTCPRRLPISIAPPRWIGAAWYAPEPFTYESGKTLMTLRTEHRANYDLAHRHNAIEMFFFTREYGWSRWESWMPQARCIKDRGEDAPSCFPRGPANILRGRCDPASGEAMRGGQLWVRVDCRDNTFFMTAAQ